MGAILLPHDGLVQVLRGSNIPKLDWTDGPYYEQAAEPQPDFPFLVYLFEPKEFQPTFEKPFIAVYDVTLTLHALQPDIAAMASEYGSIATSVFAFLDQYISNPNGLSQAGVYTCFQFLRNMPIDIRLSEFRSPQTPRVYKGEGKYTMAVTADLN